MKTRKGQRREVTPARRGEACDSRAHLEVGYRGRRARRLRVPPPESDIWPPQYRGERWKRIYGILFEGKCLLCRYGFSQPESRQKRDLWLRQDTPLLCTNHAACPGEMIEVPATGTCRNFKARCWRHPRKKPEAVTPIPWPPKRKKGVRLVPLSQGLFATVDAADYKRVSKYKWSVCRVGNKLYAQARINGRTVAMHRFLLRPRRGYQVDHIDGNGLNNCRSNLRECTAGQNQANRRPRGGSSRFVGVTRRGDRWEAWITYRGRWYTLGTYADEVEAAKARDRKAVELHGVYAYLNFPEDWTFDKNGVGHRVRAKPNGFRKKLPGGPIVPPNPAVGIWQEQAAGPEEVDPAHGVVHAPDRNVLDLLQRHRPNSPNVGPLSWLRAHTTTGSNRQRDRAVIPPFLHASMGTIHLRRSQGHQPVSSVLYTAFRT